MPSCSRSLLRWHVCGTPLALLLLLACPLLARGDGDPQPAAPPDPPARNGKSIVGDFMKSLSDQVTNFRDTARLMFRLATGERPEQVEEYFEFSAPGGGADFPNPPPGPPSRRRNANGGGQQRRRKNNQGQRNGGGGPNRQNRPNRRQRPRPNRPFQQNQGPNRLEGPGALPDGVDGYPQGSFYPVRERHGANQNWKPAAQRRLDGTKVEEDMSGTGESKTDAPIQRPEYYGQGVQSSNQAYEVVGSSAPVSGSAAAGSQSWDRMGVGASISFSDYEKETGGFPSQPDNHRMDVESRSLKRRRGTPAAPSGPSLRESIGGSASRLLQTIQNVLQEEQRKMRSGEPTTIEEILNHIQRSRDAIEAFSQFPEKLDPEVKKFMVSSFRSAQQGVRSYMENFRTLVKPFQERAQSLWSHLTRPFLKLLTGIASRLPVPQVKLPKRFVDRTVDSFAYRLIQRFREVMGIQPHSPDLPRPGSEDFEARGFLDDNWNILKGFFSGGDGSSSRSSRRSGLANDLSDDEIDAECARRRYRRYQKYYQDYLSSGNDGDDDDLVLKDNGMDYSSYSKPSRPQRRPPPRRPAMNQLSPGDERDDDDDFELDDWYDDDYDFLFDGEDDDGFGHRIRNFFRTRRWGQGDDKGKKDGGGKRGLMRLRRRYQEGKRSVADSRETVVNALTQDPFVTLSGISFAAFLTALFFNTVGGQQKAKDIPFPMIAQLNDIPIPQSIQDVINSLTNVHTDAEEKSNYFIRTREDLMGAATANGAREVKSFADEPCPRRRLCRLMVKAIRDEAKVNQTEGTDSLEFKLSAFREHFLRSADAGEKGDFSAFLEELTDLTSSDASGKHICSSLVPSEDCPPEPPIISPPPQDDPRETGGDEPLPASSS